MLLTYIVTFFCVCGMTAGQILFKLSATALSSEGTLFSVKALGLFGVAIIVYGFATLAWVWVLQHSSLGKVYPLMALAFVLVPLCSYLLFGEKFTGSYLFGVVLIIAGVVFTTIG